MNKLTRQDLYSLEQYAVARKTFRDKVLAHKKYRQVQIGDHACLYFEDRLTIQYQIQEMLRVERIFEAEGIEEELQAYNPLIPDGDNWKATFMLEYTDIEERRVALAQLQGIEDSVWVQIADFDKIYGIANEDLERSTEEKTSAVHFMRFQLPKEQIALLHEKPLLKIGIDHKNYKQCVDNIEERVISSLLEDTN